MSDTTLRCWGENSYGGLGDGTTNTQDRPVVAQPGMPGAVEVAVGAYHTCAILLDGTVRCWGLNAAGELGVNNTEYQPAMPPLNPGLSGVLQLATNAYATCARCSPTTRPGVGETTPTDRSASAVALRTSPPPPK